MRVCACVRVCKLCLFVYVYLHTFKDRIVYAIPLRRALIVSFTETESRMVAAEVWEDGGMEVSSNGCIRF